MPVYDSVVINLALVFCGISIPTLLHNFCVHNNDHCAGLIVSVCTASYKYYNFVMELSIKKIDVLIDNKYSIQHIMNVHQNEYILYNEIKS